MNKFYKKSELLKRLKEMGLPCSYQTLMSYERQGIVPKPKHTLPRKGVGRWRLYTKEEIDEIIKILTERLT